MTAHPKHVTFTPSDNCACAAGAVAESECDHEAWLVFVCCPTHGLELSSVGGSRIEFPREGGAYTCVSGVPWDDLTKEVAYAGFTWREEA